MLVTNLQENVTATVTSKLHRLNNLMYIYSSINTEGKFSLWKYRVVSKRTGIKSSPSPNDAVLE